MRVYLASPNTQQQAEHVEGMDVLLSYACCPGWMDRYQASFRRVLIDSGAFSEFSTGKKVDPPAYAAWAARWEGHADAVAGLDSIAGDWRQSMKNYLAFEGGFPTYHETDPPEFLDDVVALAAARSQWVGLGFLPATRNARGGLGWLRDALARIPEGVHVHVWAGRAYTDHRRVDSVDSTNWWRDAMKLRTFPDLEHLTYGECLGIVVKRYQRWQRTVRDPATPRTLMEAFGE